MLGAPNIGCLVAVVLIFSITDAQLYGPNRPQTISNIFQIPIQTLTAISNVVQNTRPIGDVVQQRIMRVQQLQQSVFNQGASPGSAGGNFGQNSNYLSSNYLYSSQQSGFHNRQNRQYPSRASQIAGLSVAADGSGFRI